MPDNEKKINRVEILFEVIHSEIKAERIKVYRNVMGDPYISCIHPKYPKLETFLFDKNVRSWFTHFLKEEKGCLPKSGELNCILEELAGRSMSNMVGNIQDPCLTRIIESEPVVAVVLEFMHTKAPPRYEESMASLWKELHKFAKERGLLVRGKNRFPAGANTLSGKLRKFLQVFEKLGITINNRRSNGSKVTIVRRLDDSSLEPSVESSELNSLNNNGLPLMDDQDDIISHLQQENERTSYEQPKS